MMVRCILIIYSKIRLLASDPRGDFRERGRTILLLPPDAEALVMPLQWRMFLTSHSNLRWNSQEHRKRAVWKCDDDYNNEHFV